MKTLLIFPPFLDHKSEYPPLGIAYIAAVLQKEGVEVDVLDLSVFRPHEWKERLSIKLAKVDPEIIGISAMTFTYDAAIEVGKYVKETNPKAKVVFGGPHPTIYPDKVLKNQFVDFVIRGEGEFAFLELVKSLSDGNNLKNINGLSFRDDGNIHHNPDRELIQNLDELPFPSRDFLELEEYSFFPAMTLISSRGCPFNCYFCFKMYGHKFRARSPENVVSEIEFLKEKYGSKNFYFYDDLFTYDKSRVMKICDLIEEKGLKIEWKCCSRVNTIDKELLIRMKRAGCSAIHYGVETGDTEIMKKIRKGITLEQVKNAIMMTKSVGIKAKAYFMVGHPWDTKETIEKTIRFAIGLNADKIQFAITTPFPKTELWNIAKEMKIVSDDMTNWNRLLETGKHLNPIMKTYTLSSEELLYYQRMADKMWYKRKMFYLLRHPKKLVRVVNERGVVPLIRIALENVR